MSHNWTNIAIMGMKNQTNNQSYARNRVCENIGKYTYRANKRKTILGIGKNTASAMHELIK